MGENLLKNLIFKSQISFTFRFVFVDLHGALLEVFDLMDLLHINIQACISLKIVQVKIDNCVGALCFNFLNFLKREKKINNFYKKMVKVY